MNLFKRCDCAEPAKCRHPFWFLFRLRRQRYQESTRTANRQLALSIAQKRRIAALETREGFRPVKPIQLSAHITAYVAHTDKTNRSSNKDRPVLDRFVASVGDRLLTDVSAFHVERWKRERAAVVSQSTVNRELNIIRGCFSRAVEWGRLGASPLRTVKAYRVDSGVSLRAVQTIGGWSSLRMLERYAHVNGAELARAVDVTQAHTDAAIHAPTKTPTATKITTTGSAPK